MLGAGLPPHARRRSPDPCSAQVSRPMFGAGLPTSPKPPTEGLPSDSGKPAVGPVLRSGDRSTTGGIGLVPEGMVPDSAAVLSLLLFVPAACPNRQDQINVGVIAVRFVTQKPCLPLQFRPRLVRKHVLLPLYSAPTGFRRGAERFVPTFFTACSSVCGTRSSGPSPEFGPRWFCCHQQRSRRAGCRGRVCRSAGCQLEGFAAVITP